MDDKHLEDFSEDEILQLFIKDCLRPPESNTVLPASLVLHILKMYCKLIGVKTPDRNRLNAMMRKYYTQTTKDNQTCYRAAIKPGLISEDL